MGSSSAQSGSWSNLEPQQRLCKCDPPQPTLWKTSNSEQNPERRYWYCRRRGRWGDCKFWLWIDPELTTHYKDAIQKLKLEKDLAVEQLLRETKNKKTNGEVEEQEFEEHNSGEDLKQVAKNLKNLEGKIKILYLLFVVVGLLVLFFRA